MGKYGKWLNLAGKIFGGLLIGAPALEAVNDSIYNNNWLAFPSYLTYRYSGYNPTTRTFDSNALIAAAAEVAAGFAVMKLFSYIARRF